LIDCQRHITPLHAITLFHARCHYDAAIDYFHYAAITPLRHCYAIIDAADTPLILLPLRH
jgi:hypothetical protein